MSEKFKILVVDDEKTIRETLSTVLEDEGYKVETASNGEEALKKIEKNNFDIAFIDIKMPKMDGMQLLERIAGRFNNLFVIIITAYGTIKEAVESLKTGAYDYLLKPFEFEEIFKIIENIKNYKELIKENLKLRKQLQYLKKNFEEQDIFIGSSEKVKNIYKLIEKLSAASSNVLIQGASGTGKELVAKAIHYKGLRADKAFIPVNCSAIPENLFESELFGHLKGSFTGAVREKPGLLLAANEGTMFLDEISSMNVTMQAKLLRVIEDKKIWPIGAIKPIDVNVRIIAATNKPLEEEVKNKTFREDLFYRLNVIQINIPPLRERKEDIPLLANYFLQKFNKEIGKNIKAIDDEVIKYLISYEWKGNVRELENVIERAVILCDNKILTKEYIPDNMKAIKLIKDTDNLKDALNLFEKNHILYILKKFKNDKEKASKALGLSIATLYRKLAELEIGTKEI